MRIKKSEGEEVSAKFGHFLECPLCDVCGADEYAVLRELSFSDASFSRARSESFKYASPDRSMGAIVQCRRCGLVYQNPRDRNVARIYEEVGEDEFYVSSKADRIATCERDADRMERIVGTVRGKRLLDVGCSYGLFLDCVKARGAETFGVELSRHQRTVALKNHPHICSEELKDCGYPENHFDLLTLWDVIEHLSSPRAFLADAHHVVRRGGFLVICTPNRESVPAKLFGKYWINFARMHFYYFSPRTLSFVLERAGFRVVAIEKHRRVIRPENAIAWMKKYPVAYAMLHALSRSTPLGAMKWASGLSGNMVVYAQKK